MTQQMMSEKEMYLQGFERGYRTTLKVLKAFPPDQMDLKPSPKSQTARELAWTLTIGQMVGEFALVDELTAPKFPPAPAKWEEILATIEQAHKTSVERLSKITEAQWNGTLKMGVGRKLPRQVDRSKLGSRV